MKEDERLSVIEVDYKREDTKRRFNDQDICIHLIGQIGKYDVGEEEYEEINAKLTMKILRWCEQGGVKQFIFAVHRVFKDLDIVWRQKKKVTHLEIFIKNKCESRKRNYFFLSTG